MRYARLLLTALALLGGPAMAQEADRACDASAARAERDWNVPAGVLSAVGTVESGRQHGPLGAAPWPWTINAAGRGYYFDSKAEAIDAVLALMQRGYPYIDVGCFQIDIAYHPDLFRSLDEAFDPERNAQAAARLLATERARVPDWATAVAHYHSATPSLGGPYLQRVRAALPGAKLRGESARSLLDWSGAEPTVSPTEGATPTAQARPALPRVIYSTEARRGGREPQIVYIGDVSRLPKVIVNEIASLAVRR